MLHSVISEVASVTVIMNNNF